jgi:hypothetical protein
MPFGKGPLRNIDHELDRRGGSGSDGKGFRDLRYGEAAGDQGRDREPAPHHGPQGERRPEHPLRNPVLINPRLLLCQREMFTDKPPREA